MSVAASVLRVRFGGTLTGPVGLKAWSVPSQNSGGRTGRPWSVSCGVAVSGVISALLLGRGGQGHDEVAGRAALAAGPRRHDDAGDREVDHRRPLDHLAERHR